MIRVLAEGKVRQFFLAPINDFASSEDHIHSARVNFNKMKKGLIMKVRLKIGPLAKQLWQCKQENFQLLILNRQV